VITEEILDACAQALRSCRNVPGVGDPGPWEQAPEATRGAYRGEALVVIGAYNAARRAAAARGAIREGDDA
jgi:hypothetical protein